MIVREMRLKQRWSIKMINKHYYTWNDIEKCSISIVNQMYKDNWTPDYIVGITRGGNVPATIISNITGIRCEALKVSLRDDGSHNDSACWMAEDAFGNPNADSNGQGKNILIVDDINDTFVKVHDLDHEDRGLRERRINAVAAGLVGRPTRETLQPTGRAL